MKVDKDMTMGEVLAKNPQARLVLEGFGMHCCGCPVSQAEALGDACDVHGIDVDLVLSELAELEDMPQECNATGCECGAKRTDSKKDTNK